MPEVVVSHFYPCSTDALKAEGKRQKKKGSAMGSGRLDSDRLNTFSQTR